MKKLCTFLLLALLCIFVAASMLSCNEGDASPSTGGTPPTQQGGTEGGGTQGGGTQGGGTQGGGTQGGGTQGGGTQGGDAQKLNFEGVVFNGATYDYDGTEKTIQISGATLPAGASVTYTNNKGTDADTYSATAVITCEGYNTLTLTATLKINKINFVDVYFESKTYDYDGMQKTLLLSGATLPAGADVNYTNNTGTDADTYNATAVITCKNYNTLTLTATLKINKINFGTITFNGSSFEYDAQEHTISATGNIPAGASVSYSGGENGKNGATHVGSYTVTVTVTHKNYNTFTTTAVLKITSKEEPLSVAFSNGGIYFQNALDGKYLYSYKDELSFVSRDTPVSMITVGNKMYYISSGLLSSGIYCFDPATGKAECLFEASADMLISDGTYLYYNTNSIFKAENNGIYRVAIADLQNKDVEVIPTRLTSVKSGDMTVTDGYVYFSNKSDGGKLYAVSTEANNATPVKIYDYKVSDIITDGEKIYFVREITLTNLSAGAAIYSINVNGGLATLVDDESSKVVKITMSKGKYLTIIGEYLYFVNTDMVTATIFGDGIYRAKLDGSGWIGDSLTLLVGASKVVDGESDNIYGLASDGTALYYYRASSKHLYRYDISGEQETDLMEGFTPPEKTEIIISQYEKAEEHEGSIYYINMKDGGKLYRYDIATGLDVRITNLSVADFAIHDNTLYYSTVRFLVNFDLYRMSLVTGGPERISTDKCKNFSFADGKMYYTNFSGKNTLCCMDLSTLEITVLKDKDVTDTETKIVDGYLYFTVDEVLHRYELSTGTITMLNKDITPLEYIIYNNQILMMNTTGFQNSITLYDIATDTIYKLGNIGISGISDDLRGMFVYNGELYFYRNVTAGSSNKGLYKVTKSGNSYAVELVDKMEGYYMCESIVIGNKVYFMDVWQIKDSLPTTSSSAKLCVLDLTTMQVTVLN